MESLEDMISEESKKLGKAMRLPSYLSGSLESQGPRAEGPLRSSHCFSPLVSSTVPSTSIICTGHLLNS